MSGHGGYRSGAGRPKGKVSAVKQMLSAKLADHVDMAIDVLVKAAEGGDTACARDILDRVYGKPRISIEHSDPVQRPTRIVLVDGEANRLRNGSNDNV